MTRGGAKPKGRRPKTHPCMKLRRQRQDLATLLVMMDHVVSVQETILDRLALHLTAVETQELREARALFAAVRGATDA